MTNANAAPAAPVYPIQPPAGCPSYVTSSVQTQCNQALSQAVHGEKRERIVAQLDQHRVSELRVTRAVVNAVAKGETTKVNGIPLAEDWWVRWGYQTVTQAWEDAAQLARFRDALSEPGFSHVTSGHTVSPNSYHVYGTDPRSPSGCMHRASASHDLPGVDLVLAASSHRTTQGGMRGEMAGRGMMG